MKEEIFDIGGMHCAACSASVERVVKKLPGMESADVNLMFGTLNVRYDEKQTGTADIIAKVERAGFTAALRTDDSFRRTKADYSLRQLLVCASLSVILMLISISDMLGFLPPALRGAGNTACGALLQLALALPVVIIGRRYYTDGFSALFRGHPDMNSLVAMSSAASLIYSLVLTALIICGKEAEGSLFYESAAMVITLISLGKYLENGAKNKTKDAIEKLIKLTPETANRVERLEEGGWSEAQTVPAKELYTEDIILVRQGERVPADATVVSGGGAADESALTGESLPVPKTPGSEIICGSVITGGYVYASVKNVGSGTLIAGIVRFVSEAQRKKAPISRLADKVAGVFVPSVMTIALLSALAWLISGKDIAFAIRIFTSVLVIACPCAMGLATPTAIMSGTGLGAKYGILVRSGEALEKLAHTDTAVFDKTGTLTSNTPAIDYIEAAEKPGGYTEDGLLGCLAALEKYSLHPYAAAIVGEAEKRGISVPEAENYTVLPGIGITGTLKDGRRITIGSREAVKDIPGLPADIPGAVYLTADGSYTGRAVMSDPLRTEAADTVRCLADMGIKTVMISGDSEYNALKTGRAAGIGEVYSGVKPEQKAGYIAGFQKDGRTVAMIGDGINDAPALVAADVGIAVGNGTDIAIDSADAVLMQSGIGSVPAAINLGRLTIRNIKQNLFWAFCYNILAIPVAAGALYPSLGILLTPMVGGICMSLSSLFVVTNALRLAKKDPADIRKRKTK